MKQALKEAGAAAMVEFEKAGGMWPGTSTDVAAAVLKAVRGTNFPRRSDGKQRFGGTTDREAVAIFRALIDEVLA